MPQRKHYGMYVFTLFEVRKHALYNLVYEEETVGQGRLGPKVTTGSTRQREKKVMNESIVAHHDSHDLSTEINRRSFPSYLCPDLTAPSSVDR